jgi:uncharacterized protein YqeY
MIDLQTKIFEAKKSHDKIANVVLGNILVLKEKCKYNIPPKEYTEAVEIGNIRKIITDLQKELENNAKRGQTEGGRVNELKAQLGVIQKYMPKEVSEQEIADAAQAWFVSYSHDTGKTIKDGINFVKNMYPVANGKIVADAVKKVLGM